MSLPARLKATVTIAPAALCLGAIMGRLVKARGQPRWITGVLDEAEPSASSMLA